MWEQLFIILILENLIKIVKKDAYNSQSMIYYIMNYKI